MKKRTVVLFSIVTILLAVIFVAVYMIYKRISHAEEITGTKDVIPQPVTHIPPLTKGSADWPHWRGPNMDGKSAVTSIRTDWSKKLKKCWEVNYLCQGKANSTWSAPVVQGNRLVVTGRDDKSDWVFCLDADHGTLIWSAAYESASETSHGPGARATPYIDDNRVYTFGRSGDLVCWMLEDGHMVWKKNVKEPGGVEPQWGYSTSPIVFENKVIVQGGGTALVIAYDKMTGSVLWKSMEGDAGYAASILMPVDNQPELLIYHAKALSMLDPEDGKEIWSTPWATNYGVNATTPVIYNNLVFHTSGYGMGGEVLEVTKNRYAIKWKSKVIASQHSDPIVIHGYLYGYSGDSYGQNGTFKCVEMATGKEMWSTGSIGWGTMIYADGYLICLDIKGNVYLIKPDIKKFCKLGEFQHALPGVTSPAWTCPVIANGKLYLRYLQRLVCYRLNKE